MERLELQKLLLETAVCTIACDGEIHQMEVAELDSMVSEAVYFREFNGKELLVKMLEEINKSGRDFFHTYLTNLKTADLSSVQELLILEIVLRIIYADKRFDENEAIFLRLVRSNLSLHDEIVIQRFGSTPFITKAESIEFTSSDQKSAIENVLANFDDIQINTELNFNIPQSAFDDTRDINL